MLSQFFYLDRVRLQRQEKPRSVPTFVNWTTASIKAREGDEMRGNGFGSGRVLPRLEFDSVPHQVSTLEEQTIGGPVICGLIEGPTEKVWLNEFYFKYIVCVSL